jgi:hypothetical protein
VLHLSQSPIVSHPKNLIDITGIASLAALLQDSNIHVRHAFIEIFIVVLVATRLV